MTLPGGSDNLSRVRNAARDVADNYLRFARAMERLAEATKACGGVKGPMEVQILCAIQEGCSGEDRIRAFNAIEKSLR
jgi:hypothetical protein